MDEWNGDSKPCIPCVCLRLDVSSVWSAESLQKHVWTNGLLVRNSVLWQLFCQTLASNIAPSLDLVGFGDPYPERRHLFPFESSFIFQEVYEGMEHGWVPGARNLVLQPTMVAMKNWLGFHHHHPIRIRHVKSLAGDQKCLKIAEQKTWAPWIFASNFYPHYHWLPSFYAEIWSIFSHNPNHLKFRMLVQSASSTNPP